MPTKLYDNAWLQAREERRKLGTTIEQPPVQPNSYANEPSADELLRGAKDFLARPSVTTPTAADEADVLKRTTAPHQRGSLKDFTDAMKMGGSLGLEAIERSPEASTPARLAAGFGKYLAPTYAVPAALSGLRQLINPERSGSVIVPDEESRLGGAAELGGALLSAGGAINPEVGMAEAPVVSGPASASNLRKTFGARVNEEVPYQASSGRVNPNGFLTSKGWGGGWMQDVKDAGRTIPLTRAGVLRGEAHGLPSGAPAWEQLGELANRPLAESGPAGLTPHQSQIDLQHGMQWRPEDLKLFEERARRLEKNFPLPTAAERAGFPQVEADAILNRAAQAGTSKKPSAQALDEMLGSMQQVEPGAGPVIETPGWNARQRPMSEVPASEGVQLKRAVEQMKGDLAVAEASGDTVEAEGIRAAIRKAERSRRIKGGR